jgi:hypothetical protein
MYGTVLGSHVKILQKLTAQRKLSAFSTLTITSRDDNENAHGCKIL